MNSILTTPLKGQRVPTKEEMKRAEDILKAGLE